MARACSPPSRSLTDPIRYGEQPASHPAGSGVSHSSSNRTPNPVAPLDSTPLNAAVCIACTSVGIAALAVVVAAHL